MDSDPWYTQEPPAIRAATGVRSAAEDFFFGFRAFTALPDGVLAERGLGRTHHRILYFTRRQPGITTGELLAVLGITKQAAHRPTRDLEHHGLLTSVPDDADRRVRRLHVTQAGAELEAQLSGAQMELLARVFDAAGPQAEAHWLAVMESLRANLETGDQGSSPG